MTGALAGAISHVLYVISDLDDCFSGNWQVPRSEFELVGASVAATRWPSHGATPSPASSQRPAD